MRRIREVLRLRFELSRTHREISTATHLSKGAVHEYLRRALESGVTWELARELNDVELEARLFTRPDTTLPVDRVPIDLHWVHREMRKKAMTLQLLWVEYRDAARHDDKARKPYQYSQFCALYREFRGRVDVVMRQEHRAGEKVFIDYSGLRPTIVNRKTGEVIAVELFVAVLGASNYTYAEATRSQERDEFIASTARAFEYFGGVPEITVPDQLRSAVSGPERIDPDINPVFAEFAVHYGTAVIPARPRKPKDKAKVEVGVQIAQRWILMRLRKVTFFSLEDLNEAIAEQLEVLNAAPFRKLDGCRRSLFEQTDALALRPLPNRRFEPSTWKKATVHIDHHVEYEHRYYSAPHALVGAKLWVRATVSTVELVLDGQRVASHARSYGSKGTYVTEPAHRPKAHQRYGAWPPERIVAWASEIGPHAGKLVAQIMKNRPHPEQGFRSCLALISDAKRYPHERVEAACKRALAIGSPTRRSVISILRNGLDRVPSTDADQQPLALVDHDNIRGGDYYATGPVAHHHDDDNEHDRHTDLRQADGDEVDCDGRGLPRAAEGGAEPRTELRGEARLHGRPRVDGEGEPPPVATAASGEDDQ
jgi:transposase